MLPIVTNCSNRMSLSSFAAGLTVDIARIRGKLLISPAQGSLAGRQADQVRAMPWQGRPQPAAPGLGVAQDGQEGLAALIRLDGGWAWKGPGHPVDNGDQARGQRDGLRSEGVARVLFFPGFLARAASEPGTNPRTVSLWSWGVRSAGG